MLNLILAICSSAAISLIMRLSSDKVRNNVSMLAVNYMTCLVLSALFTDFRGTNSGNGEMFRALGMGVIHGVLFLAAFVSFQSSVRRNGMVLSAVFMKLGLLVPMVLAVFLFRETPGAAQIAGFGLALVSIVLINFQKGAASGGSVPELVGLLLLGGTADAMSKIFEELGPAHLSAQFLLFTFATALVLCLCLVRFKGQRFTGWELFFGFVIGIPNFFSARFLLGALESLAAVIVYPAYSVAAMLLITLAGVVFFRERLKLHQWIALGMILLALVLLNL